MSRSKKIEVLFEDKWYEATVASRDGAFRANVRYADGSMEASVEESRIRARTPGTDGRPKTAGVGTFAREHGSSLADLMGGTTTRVHAALPEGASIEALLSSYTRYALLHRTACDT